MYGHVLVQNGHDARSDFIGTRSVVSTVSKVTHRLYTMENVVPHNGFILGNVRSLQMRMSGIYGQQGRPSSYLCPLDQGVHRTDTSAVTSRHAVNLVHDQTCPLAQVNVSDSR